MNSEVDTSTFPDFHDFFFELLTHFSHYLFNTSRMNTTIGYEAVQGKASNFTAKWIKAA